MQDEKMIEAVDFFNCNITGETSRTITYQRTDPYNIPCVVSVDFYNMSISNNVTKTLNSIATDSDHIPRVICIEGNGSRPSHRGGGMLKVK